MAGIRITLVDVRLTVTPGVAFSTFTGVFVGSVGTFSSVLARRTGTFIDVDLAQIPSESCGALAVEGVDLVDAASVVEAGDAGALVGIDLAELALVAWHTDAVEVSDLVQAGGFVQAGVGNALVDVQLTSGSNITSLAFTLERALGVDAFTSVFTRVGTQRTFVHVLITGSSKIPRGAGAEVVPGDGVGVAVGSFLTGITDAGVVQLAEQTCASMRTLAVE